MTNANYPAFRKNILSNLAKLSAETPDVMQSFNGLHKSALADGALSNNLKKVRWSSETVE